MLHLYEAHLSSGVWVVSVENFRKMLIDLQVIGTDEEDPNWITLSEEYEANDLVEISVSEIENDYTHTMYVIEQLVVRVSQMITVYLAFK
jgi:hypothetical protein